MRWIIVCESALNEKNGAGMRAILPYLQTLPPSSLVSLFLFPEVPSGRNLTNVQYISVPFLNYRGVRMLSLTLGTLFKIFTEFQKDDHFLIIPNSIRDVLMGLLCRLRSSKNTVWMMDDFMASYANSPPFQKWAYSKLFRLFYRSANQRVAVTHAMDARYQESYQKTADVILGRTLSKTLPPEQRPPSQGVQNKKKVLRLVYIGTFLDQYLQPMSVLKQMISDASITLPFEINIDLYGLHAPSPAWLLPGKITYQGSLDTSQILDTLKTYDFGLVPYDFGIPTQKMLSVSFPSKLIDYMGASLPAFIIAPESLTFLPIARSKNVGLIQTECSSAALLESLNQLGSIDPAVYTEWQHNAHDWAKEDFLFDAAKVKQILFGT